MRKKFRVLRRRKGEPESYWQTFLYEFEDEKKTVAAALTDLKQQMPLTDEEGNRAAPVQWECNCLQGKCGTCAMVINGFPALACEEKLIDHEELIELMPLQKFPVIEDLVVDRSVMFEHLTRMQVWMKGKHSVPEEKQKEAFTASLCLQCGCCLEICTSYTDGEDFFGMAALVPAARVEAAQESPRKTAGMLREYRNHFYECCDEFHACEHVCPAKLPLIRLMAHMNRQMKQAEEMGGLEKDG